MENLYTGITDVDLIKNIASLDLFLLDNDDLYRSNKELIYIATYEEMKDKDSNLREQGFAYTYRDHWSTNKYVWLIIIDEDNCKKLSNDEQWSVILHELGHIFNHPIDVINLSLKDKIERRKKNMDKNPTFLVEKELFADAYVKQYNYGEALLESFKKFNNITNKNVGYYDDRFKALHSDREFKGFFYPLTKI